MAQPMHNYRVTALRAGKIQPNAVWSNATRPDRKLHTEVNVACKVYPVAPTDSPSESCTGTDDAAYRTDADPKPVL